MKVDLTARHFSPSEQLKELVYEKLKKIKKFNNRIINCNVILTKESNIEDVEIIAHIRGYDFVAHENSNNFEKSLNSAIDKITIQIKKQHDRVTSH